jgi:uncharacterized protein
MNGPREQSMEDILASIKKVIAEEKELRSASPALTLSAQPGTAGSGRSESTALVVEPRQAGDGPDDHEQTDDDGDILELHEPVVEELSLPDVDLGPPLVSSSAAQASRSRLAALQEVAATTPPGQSSLSPLEVVVRDMLKPILKDWLDHHLPAIVDEHVRREIMRITGTPV